MKITIGTVDIGMPGLGDLTRPSKQAYVKRYGHKFVEVGGMRPTDREPSWQKIPLALEALGDGVDYVWLLDNDAAITNQNVDILDLIVKSNYADLIIAKDINGINCGSFLVKASVPMIRFLQRVWDSPEKTVQPLYWEQGVMMALLKEPHYLRIYYPRQRELNSYAEQWQRGDFVLHLPATSNADRIRKFTELKQIGVIP